MNQSEGRTASDCAGGVVGAMVLEEVPLFGQTKSSTERREIANATESRRKRRGGRWLVTSRKVTKNKAQRMRESRWVTCGRFA